MALAILWQLSLRLVVAVLCVALVLSLAQLTIHGLLAVYVNIAPYQGLA